MIKSFLLFIKNLENVFNKSYCIVGLLIVFVLLSWIYWHNSSGDDLSSVYFACRLMATSNQNEVYSHSSEYYHIVDNPIWNKLAQEVGFKGFLHPYVHIPLFAASLKPLCTTMKFSTFNSFFILLIAISISLIVWLSLEKLSPSYRNPLFLISIVLWIWFSHSYRYTMFLTQTQPLFLLATISALIFAERKKEFLAGVLLACAAIVKITPIMLLLYWILSKRWKSIAWFFVAFISLIIVSLVLCGYELNLAFLSELNRISNVLLVSWNNESLASFIMGYYYPSEIYDWRMFHLPMWLKILGVLLASITISLAGFLRRYNIAEGATVSIALIGMTIFFPIAWSHYYIILIVPISYLFKCAPSKPFVWIIILVIVLMTINSTQSLFRAFFTAGLIATVMCFILSIYEIKEKHSFE